MRANQDSKADPVNRHRRPAVVLKEERIRVDADLVAAYRLIGKLAVALDTVAVAVAKELVHPEHLYIGQSIRDCGVVE